MSWLLPCLEQLAALRDYGYRPGQPTATEPAALSALALLVHGRSAEAQHPLNWLAAQQQAGGELGPSAADEQPAWGTAWALLAWAGAQQMAPQAADWRSCIARGQQALCRIRGLPGKDSRHVVEHDHRIIAWPWVVGTHSWVEPTALAVLALKATGWGAHPRARDGVRLLCDRQLPEGGCNYGNTVVLGQVLRPHLQPSGLALTALLDEPPDSRTTKSLHYVASQLAEARTAPSLAWSLLGLAAHHAWPDAAKARLAAVARTPSVAGFGAYHQSLLALAAAGPHNAWLAQVRSAAAAPIAANSPPTPPSVTPAVLTAPVPPLVK